MQRPQNLVFRKFSLKIDTKKIVKEPTCYECLSNPSCICYAPICNNSPNL